MVGNPKINRIRDRQYLNSYQDKRCCVCGTKIGVVGHHLRMGGGMGLKTGDNFTIPLCNVRKSNNELSCHEQAHRGEKSFYARYNYVWGGDVESYANKLYEEFILTNK